MLECLFIQSLKNKFGAEQFSLNHTDISVQDQACELEGTDKGMDFQNTLTFPEIEGIAFYLKSLSLITF